MNWFQHNRFLGTFLVAFALATVVSAWFLFREKQAADWERARLERLVDESNRLRRTMPFPNEENLRKIKTQTDNYREWLLALKTRLKPRMFPELSLQPNEFQTHLRQTASDVIERARTSHVQLPENFYLGFDEYATSLPNSAVAPRLGQQLRAIEWITNTIIDAHADSLRILTRKTFPEEKTIPAPIRIGRRDPKKATTMKASAGIVESTSIDVAFSGSPTAARRILNQIAAAEEQAYVIRSLQVRNQAEKGPERGSPGKLASAVAIGASSFQTGDLGKAQDQAITFIVGTEHLNVAARIEIMRFNFAEIEGR
jgi:hypothetical protein